MDPRAREVDPEEPRRMAFKAAAFDWRKPSYGRILAVRLQRLERLRRQPAALEGLRGYYAEHPADFVEDWGTTFDPRNAERGLPTVIPFVLWEKQRRWIEWVVERWQRGEPGITEKSRDSGVTWLAVALSCTLCLFHRGIVVGFGSRKAEYVDQLGSPKSIFEKARLFLQHLPTEFLGGWERDRHAPYMRISFPGTGSILTGESGDQIGRGDRTSIFFVDEAAFLERPDLVDASLSATTNSRQDISTANGRANSFAIRRHSGKVPVWTFHWRDDPRKDDDWYRKQCEVLDPVTVAGEIDLNYSASVECVLIPSEWVNAAVDAHKKLGIEPTGLKRAGLDVADEGADRCAIAMRHGILLDHLESWSGKGLDLHATTIRAFDVSERLKYRFMLYDSDGLGAGCRGDARIINEQRVSDERAQIDVEPFRGSASVDDPDGEMVPERKNKDYFANLKAQSWWALRLRFERTWRAVVKGLPVEDPDALISLSSDIPELTQLLTELSNPTYTLNNSGKILVNKAPDGARSPNLADAVMIAFSPLMGLIEMWSRL